MNKIAIAMLASTFLLLAPASSAVEESAGFTVGDKWAFGTEFDLLEEFEDVTQEIFDELDAEIENNSTGEYDDLMAYNLKENKGVVGVFYTGEVIDDLDGSIHIISEESFYLHTVIDTSITGVVFQEGNHSDVEETCTTEDDWETEDCTYQLMNPQIGLPTTEATMEIGGEFHYVTKVTTETWWTQDTFDLEKLDLTLSIGMSGGIKLKNIPNETREPKMEDVDYDGDGYPDGQHEDCDYDENKNTCRYEYISTVMETAELGASSEASFHFLFEFDPWNPLNALDLPLEENKYWDGQTEVKISGDMGGKVDIEKPVLSICPDLDCDKLPEMQELYEALTMGIEELHNNETFSITVDRDNDGQPDVIEKWDDIFPMYIPETWMDDIFQAMLEAVACEDNDPDCDETGEEELKKLDLRIENNRFAFGPYDVPTEIPYAFETGEEQFGRADDGTTYTGVQVFPTDGCSENNPNKKEDCDDEDDDRDDGDDGSIVDDGSRSGHDEEEHEDEYDCTEESDPDPFCEAEMKYFHNSETGRVTFMQMDMPHAKDDGYTITMAPVTDEAEVTEIEEKVEANADPEEPEKNDMSPIPDSVDESMLPGFGAMAAIGSLLLAGRRFRK